MEQKELSEIELSDRDREEIARLISEGNTSGILDGEEEESEDMKAYSYRIAWEVKMDKFKT